MLTTGGLLTSVIYFTGATTTEGNRWYFEDQLEMYFAYLQPVQARKETFV